MEGADVEAGTESALGLVPESTDLDGAQHVGRGLAGPGDASREIAVGEGRDPRGDVGRRLRLAATRSGRRERQGGAAQA
jgi:hypothetical protein